jgi:hypothetical protein
LAHYWIRRCEFRPELQPAAGPFFAIGERELDRNNEVAFAKLRHGAFVPTAAVARASNALELFPAKWTQFAVENAA